MYELVGKSLNTSVKNVHLVQQVATVQEGYKEKYGVGLDPNIGAFSVCNTTIDNIKGNLRYDNF